MKPVALSLGMLAAAFAAGCAIRTSDAQGRVNTFGLVWSTHPGPVPTTNVVSSARLIFGRERLPDPPRWIELHAAGLIFENTPHNFGLTLGYKDSLWVFPVADAVTDTLRIGPLEPAQVIVSQP